MSELAQERLSIAVTAVAVAETALAQTIAYCAEREAFGKAHPRLSEHALLARHAQDEGDAGTGLRSISCIELHCRGGLDATTAAMAKLETTELQFRVLDECLQLHGGYGYMLDYPIARAWADGRVQRIYGGSNEIMREIIGRSLEGRRE